MRVAFIVVSGNKYGFGHSSRVLTFLEHLDQVITPTVFTNERRKFLTKCFTHVNVVQFNLEDFDDVLINADFTDFDLIWCDLPDVYHSCIIKLKNHKKPIISYNMFDKKEVTCSEDIAIFPNFNKSEVVPIANGKVHLSGRNYIAIGKNFFYNGENKQNKILVSMGASDPLDITGWVLRALNFEDFPDHTFNIIVPDSKDHFDFDGNHPNVNFYKFGKVNFEKELKESKIIILNGGSTRYEAIAARTVFVAISIHEPQFNLTELVVSEAPNAGINLGVLSEIQNNKLNDIMKELIETEQTLFQLNTDILSQNMSLLSVFEEIKERLSL